jgi:nucleoside-diphosphate kinase
MSVCSSVFVIIAAVKDIYFTLLFLGSQTCSEKCNFLFLPPNLSCMTGKTTFTIIKPDAVEANNVGPILAMMNKAGFRIVAMKYMRLSREQAGQFYAVHKERPFFGELVDYMSRGPVVVAVLQKTNAVSQFRQLIGATDPSKAEEGTIRKLFANPLLQMQCMAVTATKTRQ